MMLMVSARGARVSGGVSNSRKKKKKLIQKPSFNSHELFYFLETTLSDIPKLRANVLHHVLVFSAVNRWPSVSEFLTCFKVSLL